MTIQESREIEKLRDELHEYHVDVQRLIQRCESCRADVEGVVADVYGLPGKKENNPGLLGEVAELRRQARTLLVALRGAWLLLTALVGAVATAFLRKMF